MGAIDMPPSKPGKLAAGIFGWEKREKKHELYISTGHKEGLIFPTRFFKAVFTHIYYLRNSGLVVKRFVSDVYMLLSRICCSRCLTSQRLGSVGCTSRLY